ncbi:MAG TPA: hypothetical protein VKP88_07960, partial [Candidatus Paceibacterota bacterium]|nr:hypothetical protein [Candidatus Paceibacterota bacterium]
RGNVPIIDENVVESDFDTTTYDADTWTVPSGESLYILANPKVTQTADGTRTGNARFLRYKFIVQVKAGDNYLKRTASTISSSTTAYTDGGTPVDVFNVLLGTHSWTTTSTDRFEFWTSPINALDGDSFSAFIPLITDGVPDDSSGVTVTVDVEAYEADGTTSSAITSAALADAVVSIEPLRIFIGDSETNTLDTLLYTSAADNNAYDVFDLPDAILGDQVSSAATRGSLRHTASEEYTSDGWGPSGATDKANLEWQVFTQMAQRREVTMLQIGTLYAGFHAAHYVYLYESTTWVPYRWSFRANSAEYDVELFEAAQNTGGITVAEPDRFDGDGSNDTGAGSGVALGLAGSIEATARSAQDTGQQLSVLFPADASGPRLRNTVGDTNYVELIARSGLSSNETVTIPSAITTFIGANGRCGTASTEYYLPLGNGSSILTSLDFKNEFVCVQAVEILDVYVRFIQTPGAVTLKLYNNGSQVDSLSPPAGTSQAYDFSGNEFDVGERIAFSIECANANIDCQVTIQMKLL